MKTNNQEIAIDADIQSKHKDKSSDHSHEKQNFIWKYIFSTDHKIIGIQYAITAMFFLFFGFILILAMRLSIGFPDKAFPILKVLLPEAWLSNGNLTPESYNMFGAMHGTIMVFLGTVPLGFAAFGNYVTPIQIGAVDMAFPRWNMASFWMFFAGGAIMLASFFLDTGPIQTGWTNYSPLSTITKPGFFTGQTFWLLGMVFLISSSLAGSINFIVTIINLRCKGMTWMRMPYFVWAMLVTAFILLLSFPPLEAGAILQLMDRTFGTSFYMPSGLVVNGSAMNNISGGGSPILYQHLFWFLGHPEVYVLLLPAIAIVAEVIVINIRKPLWGYKMMVYATLVLGFLSFLVWAHHMYLTDMGNKIATFFQTTTVIISIPSVILLTCLLISLWGGSIRFTPAMLFAVAFLPLFGIGGLTGLPLAFASADTYLHDTYYVIAHFHYVVAPGILTALFAGVYHWFPKLTGRFMSEKLTHLHFWPTMIFMNLTFMPMFIQGFAGFHRRWHDGGVAFSETTEKWLFLNPIITYAAIGLFIAQIPFLINITMSIFTGKKIPNDNPWDATTLEWATPTPPGHGNFKEEMIVYNKPYQHSVPGMKEDFLPQWVKAPKNKKEKS